MKAKTRNIYRTDYQFQKFTTLIVAILHKRRLKNSKKYLEEDFQKLEFTLPANSTAVALKTW